VVAVSFSLIIFESIAVDPGGTSRELNVIQNYKNIRKICLVKKTWKRKKIRLICG